MSEAAPETVTPEVSTGSDVSSDVGGMRSDLTTPSDFQVPEAYQDRKWAQGISSVDDLWKMNDNAQSLIGKRAVPAQDAPQEEWQEYLSQLAPESIDAYELSLGEDVDPEMFSINEEVQTAYKEKFKELGITPYQAQELFKFHAQSELASVPTEEAISEEFEAMMDERFGEDKANVYKAAKSAMNGLNAEEINRLASLPNDSLVEVVNVLASVTKKYTSEDSMAGGGGESTSSVSTEEARTELANLRISAAYKDPTHKDHASTKKRVDELSAQVQRAYNG